MAHPSKTHMYVFKEFIMISSTLQPSSLHSRPVLPPLTTAAPPTSANPPSLSSTSSSSASAFPNTLNSPDSANDLMAMQKGPLSAQLGNPRRGRRCDFDALLLGATRSIGEYATLDARLCQSDEPSSFHITAMNQQQFEHLKRFDSAYSINARI